MKWFPVFLKQPKMLHRVLVFDFKLNRTYVAWLENKFNGDYVWVSSDSSHDKNSNITFWAYIKTPVHGKDF